MDFGPVVRERRTELRLTQQDLADLAGVSERFVRSLENGKRTVSLQHTLQVLDVLGLRLKVEVAT